jgi:hypothetical protein
MQNKKQVKKRLVELERILLPTRAKVVIIEPGDPIPEGAEVVIIDNIAEGGQGE